MSKLAGTRFIWLMACLWLASATQTAKAQTPSGSIVGWGANAYGENNVPAGLGPVKAVSAGYYDTVALLTNGTVAAWGDTAYGATTVPAGLKGVTAIAAGYEHTVALLTNGTVVVWGNNADGQLNIPAGLSNVMAIAAGYYDTAALLTNGTVVAWGWNFYGQTNVPAGLSNVLAVAVGDSHIMALQSNGMVVAWGQNNFGQTNVPPGLSNVIAIAAGYYYSAALRSNGTVVAWGDNAYGETNVPTGLSHVAAISTGFWGTVALLTNGTVVAWGDNTAGQLTIPAGLTNVTAIAAGYQDTEAIIAKGPATVTLGNLSQPYDGAAESVSVTTIPPGLAVIVTYNGSTNAPTNAGSYTVVGTINNPYYQGSATNTLVIGVPSLFQPVTQLEDVFTLNWSAVSGEVYLVEYKNSLSQTNWGILDGAVVATGTTASVFDVIAPAFPERFYRVGLLPSNGGSQTPVVGITSPAANQQSSSAVLTASGTATDSIPVAGVFYQVNLQPWTAATTTNRWTNWTAKATLVPGSNSVQAYAVDTAGKFSTTNRVSFKSDYSQSSPILLLNQPLPHAQVGRFYFQPVGRGTSGSSPYYFSLDTLGGFPPIGIIMDLNGNLSGTPSVAGTYDFGVCVVDQAGHEDCETATLVVDPTYTLTITMTGGGRGTVTANPPGLTYTNGTVVTLTATPASGSTFGGWSGGASGTAGSTQVTITGNTAVTAEFDNPTQWNGTWNSTQNFVSSDGSCSQNVTASISLTFSVGGGAVSGSGTENGIPCFNSDCSVDSYPTVTGPVSGSVSGSTISLVFSGVANGGACAGQSVGFSFAGTLVNSNTISNGTYTYTRQ